MHNPDRVLYDSDLAYIHDVGFTKFATGAAPGLLELMHEAGVKSGLVVDLGCGSGNWARHLVDSGFSVVGVDISLAMIDLARAKVPNAALHGASAFDFPMPECRAVTALGEVLCFREDPSAGEDPLPAFFQKVHQSLDPGGLFVFDLCDVGLDRTRVPAWFEGEDWGCGVRFEYDESWNQLRRHIVTFVRQDELYRRREVTHRLQLYDPTQVVAMLEAAGFSVQTVRSYGDFPLPAGRTGYVATRI